MSIYTSVFLPVRYSICLSFDFCVLSLYIKLGTEHKIERFKVHQNSDLVIIFLRTLHCHFVPTYSRPKFQVPVETNLNNSRFSSAESHFQAIYIDQNVIKLEQNFICANIAFSLSLKAMTNPLQAVLSNWWKLNNRAL